MCLKFEYESVHKAFILNPPRKICGVFSSIQDFIFCKNNYGEFGGLYRRATLTGSFRKVDFFTFTSHMLQKFELSQRNMLLEYPKAIFLCLSVL